MHVTEIAPRLWRWTAYHEEWQEEVGSVFQETRDGVVLIDPLVPRGDEEARFFAALDKETHGASAVHILVTVFWHTRSSRELAERLGARVWAPTRGRAAIERRAGAVTDTFRPGDALPGGIVPYATARGAEVVFWLPEQRTLVPGDALLGEGAKGGGTRSAGPAGLRLCPASWLPEKVTQARFAESLRPLLDLPVERVLVSHGEPVLENARAALAAALDVE